MIDATPPPAIRRRRRVKYVAGNAGKTLLRTQYELIKSPAIIKAIFGGWRSGKTRGCALAFYANCLANPWRKDYGGDQPFSLVIGISFPVLRDSAYRELKAVIPPEAIVYDRIVKGSWEILLANGHVIKFRTVKGALEGASACGVWLDEAQELPDEQIFLNYQMRASDALGARFLVLVSGLPESGWLQDTFDRPDHAGNPNRLVLHARTADNHYNPPHVIAEYRASVSKLAALKYLEGLWMPKETVVYYQWDPRPYPTGNLWDWAGDRSKPVHVSFDIGNKGAVLFLQEVQRKGLKRKDDLTGLITKYDALGLHIVDELLPDHQSTKAAARAARERGWKIIPGLSKIFVDPTTRADEFDSLREVFGPDIDIIRKYRGDKAENVEFGIDAVNAAMLDVDDNIRLTVYSSLPRSQRSLLSVIHRYHRGPNGKPVRDDEVDHVLDALRYPVAHLLPIRQEAA